MMDELTESQFLKRPVSGFREVEPHKYDFVCEPGAIHDEPFPRDVLETDRIDEGGEETSQATEELENGDTAGSLQVWPHLDHVGYIMSVQVRLLNATGNTYCKSRH